MIEKDGQKIGRKNLSSASDDMLIVWMAEDSVGPLSAPMDVTPPLTARKAQSSRLKGLNEKVEKLLQVQCPFALSCTNLRLSCNRKSALHRGSVHTITLHAQAHQSGTAQDVYPQLPLVAASHVSRLPCV